MKRKIFSLMVIMALLFTTSSLVFAVEDYVTATVSAAPPIAGTFTAALRPQLKNRTGFLNISVSGTWVANVYLQRSFDGTTYHDVNKTAWTVNCQHALIDKQHGVYYRLGVKNAGYTSGSVVLYLSRERGE